MERSRPEPTARRTRLPLPPPVAVGFLLAIVTVGIMALVMEGAMRSRAIVATRLVQSGEVVQRLERIDALVRTAESGQRGFLLVGRDSYLGDYDAALAQLPVELAALRTLLAGTPDRLDPLTALESGLREKQAELDQTLKQARAGDRDGALALVATDRGRMVMDRVKTQLDALRDAVQRDLDVDQAEWKRTVDDSMTVLWTGCIVLAVLVLLNAVLSSRDFRAREALAWVRAGQSGLSERMSGDLREEVLGERALEFLARYLGAAVGAVNVVDPEGFRRVAGYALGDAPDAHVGAVAAQAARERRALRLTNVPQGHLRIESTTVSAAPAEVLVAPALADGRVEAVIELGFLRPIDAHDLELLDRSAESLGVAVRSARDRTRLEALLEETQRQAEELQAQQEELRVSNEELEEQGRALQASQAALEAQQVELQQTNTQLEEQASMLEAQRDEVTRTQSTLIEKAAELERASQYKNEFLANMSHELRTPLNSTLILAKLLSDNAHGNLTAEQVDYARTIVGAGNDLLALINDILDLAKIESGKVELLPQDVALDALLDSLDKGFRAVAGQKGLDFRIERDGDAPALLETDPQRLAQVLRNLLSNALKFTESGEVVTRVGAHPGGCIAFTVRDTGIGIPEDKQEIIFEAFRQADGSTHRRYGGTGLGLSISRDLARLLGGSLTVRSALGRGSEFTLVLPVRIGQAAKSAAEPVSAPSLPAPAPAPAARPVAPVVAPTAAAPALPPIEDDRERLGASARRLLVVEDDLRFAAILRDLARESGFGVVVAATAHDGLAAAAQYSPHAILLDVNLPDFSGLGVLERLKRDPRTRHVPVHVLSVGDHVQEARERGAVGFALKPVQREQVLEALRRVEKELASRARRILVVEDDERQRESIRRLLDAPDVEIVGAGTAGDALRRLAETTFDCMVMDLSLPDMSGYELLERMSAGQDLAFPPVIVYTGRSLTRDEEQSLRRFSRSIIVKGARSPERLLDEVTLFLHSVESRLPAESQRLLRTVRDRDEMLEGRSVLVVEDDVRNIFALSRVLEPKGLRLTIARNGREALEALERADSGDPIDLVLMDIMMPEMDGLTAMREIRKRPSWAKLPIIALTAKAMRDDQEKCIAAGANDYIAKPLDVDKLVSLVRVWMPK